LSPRGGLFACKTGRLPGNPPKIKNDIFLNIMEYNTTRGTLQMREYGRHVQKMVDYLLTIEDRGKRQKNAEGLIELMSFLNPGLKIFEDYRHKLWDHLFFMSDFQLDVDSPYERPTRETYRMKPDPLPYPGQRIRHSHLGKNLEQVIDLALKEPDPEKKSGFAHAIAHYMKLAYSTWHKELVHDDTIRQELNAITNGELEFTNTPFVRHRPTPFRDDDAFMPVKRKFNKNKGGGRNIPQPPQGPNRQGGRMEGSGGPKKKFGKKRFN
jgi:Domain of unknown function (DUF4290)